MNITPIGDRLAVREIVTPQLSAGGIYIGERKDDGFVKQTVRGTVLAVGPGREGGMWGIEAGQEVEYSPVGSATFEIEGERITFIRRDAVVGVHQ